MGPIESTMGDRVEGNRVKAQPQQTITKEYPEHWGPPPRIQTKDLRPLPGGYGRGSSTLAGWIKNNMEADAQGRPQSQSLRVLQAEKKAAEDAKKAEEESRAV